MEVTAPTRPRATATTRRSKRSTTVAIAPFAVLVASLAACSRGTNDCGSDTDTVLESPGDAAEIDVEVAVRVDPSAPTEAIPYLPDIPFNGAWYDGSDDKDAELPEPGAYTVTATQLDRIGDRVRLDFGDGRTVTFIRAACM